MKSPRPRSYGALAGHLALGLVVGVFLHYLLYRLFLPIEPFIYVAF